MTWAGTRSLKAAADDARSGVWPPFRAGAKVQKWSVSTSMRQIWGFSPLCDGAQAPSPISINWPHGFGLDYAPDASGGDYVVAARGRSGLSWRVRFGARLPLSPRWRRPRRTEPWRHDLAGSPHQMKRLTRLEGSRRQFDVSSHCGPHSVGCCPWRLTPLSGYCGAVCDAAVMH
jgi:hypothetical protein